MTKTSAELYTDLRSAYEDTRKSKVNSNAHVEFEVDLELNLHNICSDIMLRRYNPEPAKRFLCEEPVKREIFCSAFSHRIVCRLLYNYLAPVLEPTFIFDSYSCQQRKGTQFGRDRFVHHILSCSQNHQHEAFVLHGDLCGYFMAIDRRILLGIVTGRIQKRLDAKDIFGNRFRDKLDMELVEYLTRLIILRNPLKDCQIIGTEEDFADIPPQKLLGNAPPGVGLAIGDITSQLFSNVYLDELDRFAKRELKCKHYGRYVDDFYVVSRDRKYLLLIQMQIEQFLKTRLRLTLHPSKTRVIPARYGVIFLGAMVVPFRVYVSNRTVSRFHARIHDLEQRLLKDDTPAIEELLHMRSVINSYLGHFLHFNAFNILKDTFKGSPLLKYFSFDKNYRKCIISLPKDQWNYKGF